MGSASDDERIASELKGNTLRAYWALLSSTNGTIGVRELQRQLGFSSPTLASYHLNKLEQLGLATKELGDYRLVREVKVGTLMEFIKLGTFRLPRYILYATMFTALLMLFITQLREINFYSTYALVLAIMATSILWYETFRVWKQKP